MPFWYGEYTVGAKNLADEVLKRVNAVTVMSYRDTGTGPNSMLAISQDWLTRGAAAGKRVRLGAETSPLPDCTHCTFAEEGATRLTAGTGQGGRGDTDRRPRSAGSRSTGTAPGARCRTDVSTCSAFPASLIGKEFAGPAGHTDERNGSAGPAFPPAYRTGNLRPQPDCLVAVRLQRTRIVETAPGRCRAAATAGARPCPRPMPVRVRSDERTRRRGRSARPAGSG